jgi:hypothetical protein
MLSNQIIEEVVQRALNEDAPWGDVTSEHLIPATATATAELAAREAGVFSGADVFAAAFLLTDPSLDLQLFLEARDRSVEAGQVVGDRADRGRGVHDTASSSTVVTSSVENECRFGGRCASRERWSAASCRSVSAGISWVMASRRPWALPGLTSFAWVR